MPPVLYSREDATAFITLNRPDRLNAINRQLADELHAALHRALADSAARVLVLSGAGRAFCAGDDLVELTSVERTPQQARAFVERLQEISRLLMLERLPVICAVEGWAIGGGASWTLNADFAVWSKRATFFCPEASHGLFVSGGLSMLLPERCGSQRAQSILLLGERITGSRLMETGLASHLAEEGATLEHARQIAAKLCELPQTSILRFRRARADQLRARFEHALAIESEHLLQISSDPQVAARLPDLGRIRP